jgi:hypothetical protein
LTFHRHKVPPAYSTYSCILPFSDSLLLT